MILFKPTARGSTSPASEASPQTTIGTRLLVLSDTHDLRLGIDDKANTFSALPEVDVVLHCGDLTEYGGLENYKAAMRLLGTIKAELRLFIAGNHDVSLDPNFHVLQEQKADVIPPPTETFDQAMEICTGAYARDCGVTYLSESLHHFKLKNGAALTVFASPFSLKHGEWAFQYAHNEDRYNRGSEGCSMMINTATSTSTIPSHLEANIDVLMTHGPPRYMFDSISQGGHAGCEALLKAVSRSRPSLHCFGHVHENWGARAVLWHKPSNGSNKHKVGGDSAGDAFDKEELAPVFMGRNEIRRKGYAALDTTRAGSKRGEVTWMVNAAIRDVDGVPNRAPWLVTIALRSASESDRRVFHEQKEEFKPT